MDRNGPLKVQRLRNEYLIMGADLRYFRLVCTNDVIQC